MKPSRRDFSFLFPILAAAQEAASDDALSSATFRNEDIAPHKSGPLVSRPMVKGKTHSGYFVDMHESELPAGQAPHPPHSHVHEEMLLIREGLLDITTGGKTTRLGPGSAAYFASRQEHGWHNAGNVTARYFVIALGDDKG